MNESEYQSLLEQSWRRPLTVSEQARLDEWLAAHPEAQPAAEVELALSHLLGQLPDVPVASNFTTLVMQSIDREQAAASPQAVFLASLRGWWRAPAPRLAWVAALVLLGWFGFHQHQTNIRQDVAKGISVMANVASLTDPASLQDFEAISRLNVSEDDELFAVLTSN